MSDNILELEGKVVEALKNVFDPEIPVNIYDLGLIYEIDIDDDKIAHIKMTLTAPNCPMVDDMLADVHVKVGAIKEINKVDVKLVFDPPWDQTMLTDEAKLELGLL